MVLLRKKYTLLFHNGSVKEKTIKVWYSKAQYLPTQNTEESLGHVPDSPLGGSTPEPSED